MKMCHGSATISRFFVCVLITFFLAPPLFEEDVGLCALTPPFKKPTFVSFKYNRETMLSARTLQLDSNLALLPTGCSKHMSVIHSYSCQ